MKRILVLGTGFMPLHAAELVAATSRTSGVTVEEEQRKHELQNRLCQEKELSCKNVTSLFGDPRLAIYRPPEPTPEQPPSAPGKERERNPYFTKRFGLLTPESFERCRSFIQAHALTFDAAYAIYSVPKETICGHMRIETDF